jgi:hypothetical protein
MHISLTLPHPLARLSRILIALEHARAGTCPHLDDEHDFLDRHDESRGGASPEYCADMEFLSLSRCEPPPARRSDELDFWSLSRVEETVPDRHDSLSNLSLEESFPTRPEP